MIIIDIYLKYVMMMSTFSVCTYAGFSMAKKLSKRYEELDGIEKTVIALRGEINYKSTVLEEAFSCIKDKSDGFLKVFLEKVCEDMEENKGNSMEELTEKHMDLFCGTSLNKQDKKAFEEFMGNLGYLDKKMQLSVIDMYLEKLKMSKEESKNEINRSSKMYKCMGAFVGIMVCIFVA